MRLDDIFAAQGESKFGPDANPDLVQRLNVQYAKETAGNSGRRNRTLQRAHEFVVPSDVRVDTICIDYDGGPKTSGFNQYMSIVFARDFIQLPEWKDRWSYDEVREAYFVRVKGLKGEHTLSVDVVEHAEETGQAPADIMRNIMDQNMTTARQREVSKEC